MKYENAGEDFEELATFGAGCYWGTEKYYVRNLQQKFPDFVLGQAVGFMSPNEDAPKDPLYREVKQGDTTHVEVLHLKFDNRKISYEELVRFFFTMHDPTTFNKQGNDKGTQYASTIFYHSEAQRKTAELIRD